ncbi:MAG: hypothetical protein SF029_06985 [bacterium]|nr:hypothetical protein [bacterium]
MPTVYYRYVSYLPELEQLRDERKIQSTNPTTQYRTWYTTERYDSPDIAQQRLALKTRPLYRIGPISAEAMPDLTLGPRRVAPDFGQPGGGIEVAIDHPVWLFGVWNFDNQEWEMLP